MSTKELKAAAMKLPPKKRVQLAEQLLASIDAEIQRKIDAEWAAEVEDRIDALDAGEMRSEPSSKVVKRIRNRLRR